MSDYLFQSGDRVFHPIYGLGVVEGQGVRDRPGLVADDYRIHLSNGATLSVPVARAEALGLRPVVNGMTTIISGLRSPAQPLPPEDHHRAAELKARSQAPQSTALTQAVRDLLNYGQTHRLTPADKDWLSRACECLSTEAAWVDAIDPDKARTAIQQEVARFKPDDSGSEVAHGRKPGRK